MSVSIVTVHINPSRTVLFHFSCNLISPLFTSFPGILWITYLFLISSLSLISMDIEEIFTPFITGQLLAIDLDPKGSGPVTCLQDGHQWGISCQSCRCYSTSNSTQRIRCLSNTSTFLTQEEIILAHTPCAAYYYKETEDKGSLCHK